MLTHDLNKSGEHSYIEFKPEALNNAFLILQPYNYILGFSLLRIPTCKYLYNTHFEPNLFTTK